MNVAHDMVRQITEKVEQHRGLLEKALGHGGNTHNVEDIVAGVLAGHMQLWPGEDSVVVTEIITYPRKRVLHIFLAAGILAELRDMEPSVEQFARLNGCEAMTIAGRAGWAKALADLGYRENLRSLHKEVAQ